MEAFGVQNKKCNCLHELRSEINEMKNLMSYFHEKVQNIEKVNGDMLAKMNLLVQAQLSTLLQPTNTVLLNTLQQLPLPNNMKTSSTYNSMGSYNSMRHNSTDSYSNTIGNSSTDSYKGNSSTDSYSNTIGNNSTSSYSNTIDHCKPLHSIPVDHVFPNDRNDCNVNSLETLRDRNDGNVNSFETPSNSNDSNVNSLETAHNVHNFQEVEIIHEVVTPVEAGIKSLITAAGYGDMEVEKVLSMQDCVPNRSVFARRLTRMFFQKSEMAATWYGTSEIRKPVKLDSTRISLIKDLVLFKFPVECSENEGKVRATIMVHIQAMCRSYRAIHRKLLIANN